MVTKIRKQIYLDAQQNEMLKQTSRKLGISEAEIIRQAVVVQAGRVFLERKTWLPKKMSGNSCRPCWN
jgi:hypothetical protein